MRQSLRPACAYAQSDHILCESFEYSMSVKLLTEHHLKFLSLKGGCTDLSESTLVKMPHCRKSHAELKFINLLHRSRPSGLIKKPADLDLQCVQKR